MPTMEELKKVLFEMNSNSAPGLDGIEGKFYQTWFGIIKFDLFVALQSLFSGQQMPNYITYSCLVFLPKTEHHNNLRN